MRSLLYPVVTNGAYLPANGRLPWLAFFMRSFFSLRRRVLAMMPPAPRKGFLRLCVQRRLIRPCRRDSLQRKRAKAHQLRRASPAYHRSMAN